MQVSALGETFAHNPDQGMSQPNESDPGRVGAGDELEKRAVEAL